jgi:flagellar motor switch protein FliN
LPSRAGQGTRRGGFDLLHGVDMEITVELGRTSMTVRELLSLSTGSVIELDRTAGSPADVLVNRRLIARGEIVVIDEYFGIRITEILPMATATRRPPDGGDPAGRHRAGPGRRRDVGAGQGPPGSRCAAGGRQPRCRGQDASFPRGPASP